MKELSKWFSGPINGDWGNNFFYPTCTAQVCVPYLNLGATQKQHFLLSDCTAQACVPYKNLNVPLKCVIHRSATDLHFDCFPLHYFDIVFEAHTKYLSYISPRLNYSIVVSLAVTSSWFGLVWFPLLELS